MVLSLQEIESGILLPQVLKPNTNNQSSGGELLRKSAEDAKVSAIQECQQAPHIAL
jgi:hypothetical protein